MQPLTPKQRQALFGQRLWFIMQVLLVPDRYKHLPKQEYSKVRAFNAAILIICLIILFIVFPAYTLFPSTGSLPQRFGVTTTILIICLSCYFLSWIGQHKIAVNLFFPLLMLVTVAFAMSMGREGMDVIYYLFFVMGWATFFLSWRNWLLLLGANFVLVVTFFWITPEDIHGLVSRNAILFHLIGGGTLIGVRMYMQQGQKRHQLLLAQSEMRLRAAIESSEEAYAVVETVRDEKGEIVDFMIVEVNEACCKQVDRTREQMLYGYICELFPVTKKGGFFEQYKEAVETGKGFSQEYFIPGDYIGAGWFYHHVTPLANGFVMMNRDINQRKQFELEMVKRQNRLQSLVESQSSYLVRTDLKGNYTFANKSFLDRFGYDLDTIIGLPALKTIYPEDHDKTIKTVEQCYQNPGVPISVTLKKLLPNGEVAWVDWEFMTIEDNVGEIAEIQCVGLDITDRMVTQANLLHSEQLRLQLEQQADLNQIKTRMMTRISHEFRTPLSIIRSSTNLIERYGDRMDDNKRAEKLRHINEEVDRLALIVADMGRILNGQVSSELMLVECDIQDLVATIVARYLAEDNHAHSIVIIAQEKFPHVRVDLHLMELIIGNLVSNALKYSPKDSHVTINLTYDERHFTLTVIDNGIGILSSEQIYIYDPFFRGSNFGELGGMGLGLSLVKNAVDAHGGSIKVVSQAGKGTTFTVTLPIRTEM
ncbi:MAG: ATP-binding protein [bacterium]|nr:ATP-binding protein [bacterium]